MEGRTCTKCNKWKRASCFEKNGKHPDGRVQLRSICKKCGSRKKLTLDGPKRCSKCRKVKPPEEFSSSHSPCKECHNQVVYAYRRGAGRAAHNARMSAYVRQKWKSDPEYRLKTQARQAAHMAVKAGILKKPRKCPKCGRTAVLHAHHYKGYDEKNWLKVRWRCARCHFREDRAAHR